MSETTMTFGATNSTPAGDQASASLGEQSGGEGNQETRADDGCVPSNLRLLGLISGGLAWAYDHAESQLGLEQLQCPSCGTRRFVKAGQSANCSNRACQGVLLESSQAPIDERNVRRRVSEKEAERQGEAPALAPKRAGEVTWRCPRRGCEYELHGEGWHSPKCARHNPAVPMERVSQ